tara:strand:- start:4210 stop:7620 length:3411 start_codon:yes stop_codon:yes gene_type:complete
MYLTSVYNEKVLLNLNNINKYLDISQIKSIDNLITSQLKNKIGNKCNYDGYVIKNSIELIYRNIGEIKGNDIEYSIKYKAKIIFPNEGCLLKDCKIIFSSDLLYVAELRKTNFIIIIPKHYLDKTAVLKLDSYINILCLDNYYEINDKYIFIIGIPTNENKENLSLTKDDEDDKKCEDITNNITEYKEEYYNLFNKYLDEEEANNYEIEYERYEYDTTFNINNIIIDLRTSIINMLEEGEYNIDINVVKNYTKTYPLELLLELTNNNNINNILYRNYKLALYSNYNLETYTAELSKITHNKETATSNEGTLVNSSNICYIISTIQILKNCKIFLYNLKQLVLNSYDEEHKELVKMLIHLLVNTKYETYDLEDFIKLLNQYLTKRGIDFDIYKHTDVNDFIEILLEIINTTIDKTKYVVNVYDDILPSYNGYNKSNNTQNIKHYIEFLDKKNRVNLLGIFYKITVDEFKCSNCMYRYYNIYNKLVDMVKTNNVNSNTENYVKNIYEEKDVECLNCPICRNTDISMKKNAYINELNYCIYGLDRIDLSTINIKKNVSRIEIEDTIIINNINKETSINKLKYRVIKLDLKSVICYKGLVGSGHYFALNKNPFNTYTIYDDHNKYMINGLLFNNNNIYKENVCGVIYQENPLKEIPYSNLSLLDYEDEFYMDKLSEEHNIYNYISDKVKVGINIGGAKIIMGGHLFDKVNIYFEESSKIETIDIDVFLKLFRDYYMKQAINNDSFIRLLNDFIKNYKNAEEEKEKADILYKFYILNSQIIDNSIENFYKVIVKYLTDNVSLRLDENKITDIDFINGIDFLKDTNIHIGTMGYNTDKTNYWDVIYVKSENHLEMYGQQFNTLEINSTYYNDYEEAYWKALEKNLEKSTIKQCSVVFNKEFSDLFSNSEVLNSKMYNEDNDEITYNNVKYKHDEAELEDNSEINIRYIFNKHYDKKIFNIKQFVKNILFKFEESFVFNEENFNNIKKIDTLINKFKKLKYKRYFIFEFMSPSWDTTEVDSYFNERKWSICKTIQKDQFNYFNKKYFINYIKVYGSTNKYSGSQKHNLDLIINEIKKIDNKPQIFNKLKSINKHAYIYFNNVTTNRKNKEYSLIEEGEDNLIPASVYDGKILYKVLEQLDVKD